MSHLDVGTLQAILDEDLAEAQRASAAEHLVQCSECAAQLEELRTVSRLFASAVALLDQPERISGASAPSLSDAQPVPRLVRFPRQAQNVWQSATRLSTGSLARAAILLLAFAAAASATIPGSPVRHWLSYAWDATTSMFASSPEVTEPAPQPAAPVKVAPAPAAPTASPVAVAGVSVRPVGGQVEVLLIRPDATIRVRLVDGNRVVVQASGAAATARFQTGPGRIEVSGGGTGELVIEIPRTTSLATVRVDGRVILRKEGAVMKPIAPPTDTTPSEVIFRQHF
jgi:hypothetical protein